MANSKQKILLGYRYKDKVNIFNKNITSISKISNSQLRINYSKSILNYDPNDTFFNYYCFVKTRNNGIITNKNNLPIKIATSGVYADIYVWNSELNIYGLSNDDLDINFIAFNDITDFTGTHYDFFNYDIANNNILAKSPIFANITRDITDITKPVITCILSSPMDFNTNIPYIHLSGYNYGEYIDYITVNGLEMKIYLKTANGGAYFDNTKTIRHTINFLLYKIN